MNLIQKFTKNRVAKNAGWLIGGKVLQMLISFFVGVLTTRFLGPSNYGLINYGTTYINFFLPLCTLGLNSIMVREIINHPKQEGSVIGTALTMRLAASTLAMILINLIVSVVDAGETLTRLVVFLTSFSVIFNSFEILNYWFQSRLESKISAIANLIAFIVFSVYRITLIATGKGVEYFAFATSIDYICIAVILFYAFRKSTDQKLTFNLNLGKDMLSRSYHFILPSIMVAVYGQTDKFMLKHMIDSTEIGYYSTAQTICTLWCFVLTAIIDSMYPSIMEANKDANEHQFQHLNILLYRIVFYVSMGVSAIICIFAPLIVSILYGPQYSPTVMPLRIVTWYTAFSYLGVAREAWIVGKNRQQFLKYIYISAAISNVILNLLLIPRWGSAGAAIASLLAEVLTSVVIPFFIPGMRENAILMLNAIFFREPKKEVNG